MPVPAKHFYMIRHGQSVANRDQYFSGNMDVELTDLGREQAALARQHVEALDIPPVQIVHSHLQRARNTAKIINENLKLPMHETPLLGEHHFGDWHGKPWGDIRSHFFGGENPPGGETHDEFMHRIQKGLHYALEFEGPVLIACHGGVFRAFNRLHNHGKGESSKNCVLYEFTPNPENKDIPWDIKVHG